MVYVYGHRCNIRLSGKLLSLALCLFSRLASLLFIKICISVSEEFLLLLNIKCKISLALFIRVDALCLESVSLISFLLSLCCSGVSLYLCLSVGNCLLLGIIHSLIEVLGMVYVYGHRCNVRLSRKLLSLALCLLVCLASLLLLRVSLGVSKKLFFFTRSGIPLFVRGLVSAGTICLKSVCLLGLSLSLCCSGISSCLRIGSGNSSALGIVHSLIEALCIIRIYSLGSLGLLCSLLCLFSLYNGCNRNNGCGLNNSACNRSIAVSDVTALKLKASCIVILNLSVSLGYVFSSLFCYLASFSVRQLRFFFLLRLTVLILIVHVIVVSVGGKFFSYLLRLFSVYVTVHSNESRGFLVITYVFVAVVFFGCSLVGIFLFRLGNILIILLGGLGYLFFLVGSLLLFLKSSLCFLSSGFCFLFGSLCLCLFGNSLAYCGISRSLLSFYFGYFCLSRCLSGSFSFSLFLSPSRLCGCGISLCGSSVSLFSLLLSNGYGKESFFFFLLVCT